MSLTGRGAQSGRANRPRARAALATPAWDTAAAVVRAARPDVTRASRRPPLVGCRNGIHPTAGPVDRQPDPAAESRKPRDSKTRARVGRAPAYVRDPVIVSERWLAHHAIGAARLRSRCRCFSPNGAVGVSSNQHRLLLARKSGALGATTHADGRRRRGRLRKWRPAGPAAVPGPRPALVLAGVGGVVSVWPP
jgi:hypothetical protein